MPVLHYWIATLDGGWLRNDAMLKVAPGGAPGVWFVQGMVSGKVEATLEGTIAMLGGGYLGDRYIRSLDQDELARWREFAGGRG